MDLSTASGRPLTREQAFALVDAVMARDDLALNATAYEDARTGEWVFEATCDGPPDIDSFSELARATLGGSVAFSADRIDPSIDWVGRSLEGLKPVVAGGFYIYGSHEAAAPPAGLTAIHIDAAQAFGTGHHETTTGCLEAIDLTLKRRRVQRAIDVGTGTGVLAIALAKRTRLPVVASDIDDIAVATTIENARLNGVAASIIAVRAEGLANPVIARNAPYDFIVANILAGPLTALAPGIGRIAMKGATIVLSGILTPQAARVIAAYGAQGMILSKRIVRGDWSTLILEAR